MRVLFIHKNFPAQFGALGAWLSGQDCEVLFATERADLKNPGVDWVNFKPKRKPTQGIHRYVGGLENAVITGQGFARTAVALRQRGYRPDVVVAHSGWGVGLFAKDVWPETRYVPYFEWFYRSPADDETPHDEPGDRLDLAARARVRNSPAWLDLSAADAALCPTAYQASQFPKEFRDCMTVMHDGIDTDLHSPGERDSDLLAELGVPQNAQVMTWVTRGMEPHRGFPEMMAAVSQLQRQRPNFHAIIVGEDRVAYGNQATGPWKDKLLRQHEFDMSRIHFLGRVSRSKMVQVIRSGDVHLYLTVPFVLSWSMLDAMACGASMVASDVQPVREFIEHGVHGRLVDTYDPQSLLNGISGALDGEHLGDRARRMIVDQYSTQRIYPEKLSFLRRVAGD